MDEDQIREHIGEQEWPDCQCFRHRGGDVCTRLYTMATEYSMSMAHDATEEGFCPTAMPLVAALTVDMLLTRVAAAMTLISRPGITEVTPATSVELSAHKRELHRMVAERLASLERRSERECMLNAGGSASVQ
jgi:hypothetical protein